MPKLASSEVNPPAKAASVPVEAAGSDYLGTLGQRIRALRARRGMTRRMLAAHSGVSERFLAEIETGTGNASVLTLRQLAQALDVPLDHLTLDGPEPNVELAHATELLRDLSAQELREVQAWLGERFLHDTGGDRRQRVALLGLRGAGKSTLGAMLARELNTPFFELDKLIEKASGVPLSGIFDLYGQNGFRRLERQCLDDLLARYPRFVLATGGSLVSETATFQRLLQCCFTVWLQAEPEDHMKRVIAQGDTRPMAKNPEAMSDLRRILREREPMYAKASLSVNTTQLSPDDALSCILQQIR